MNKINDIENEVIQEVITKEASAVTAYEKMLGQADGVMKTRLKEFHLHHTDALSFWKDQARIEGTIAKEPSPIWSKAIEAFVGVTRAAGDTPILMALKKGEEHALETYEELLKSHKVTSFQKDEIRNALIPRQRKHIESIDAMMKTL